MGNAIAEGQAANILPPVPSGIFALTLDATSRVKDLGSILLGGEVLEKGGTFYLTLRANVRWYFRFDAAAGGTVNEATVDAAAAAPTLPADNVCYEVAADEVVHVRVSRHTHRYLVVKGSGAGTLRAYVSSEPNGRRG